MNLGSFGVFAAVAVFESLIKKETGKTVDLAEQQIINGSLDFIPSGTDDFWFVYGIFKP